MNKLYTNNGKDFVSYDIEFSSKNKAPCIIFIHGLMSNMESSKALSIGRYCKAMDYNYIRFSNFGSFPSSGEFTDQTITSWVEGAELILNELFKDEQKLLIGSSAGAWIALLAAIRNPKTVSHLITISAATDFTENIIWDNFNEEQKSELLKNGLIHIAKESKDCNYSYPISIKLIEDGRENMLLDKDKIDISCQVHMIHGMNDVDIDYSITMKTAERIIHEDVIIKLIKDGSHRLERPQDIQVITNSIEELFSS